MATKAKQPTGKATAKKAAGKAAASQPRKAASGGLAVAAEKRPATPGAAPLTHRLDALLHTMRCITQHEDQLCSLLHHAQRTGRVSAAMRQELSAILSELPAEEYTADLRAALDVAAAT